MNLFDARRPRLLVTVLIVTLALGACGAQTTSPVPTGTSPEPTVAPSQPEPTVAQSVPAPSVEPAESETAASQEPSASATATNDACNLLAAAALEEIVGPGAVGNVMPGAGWRASQCAWNTADSSFLLSVGTAESIANAGDPAAADAAALLAAYKQAATAEGKVTDLAGVGDGAVVSTSGIAFVKEGSYIELILVGPELEGDQLVQIAKLAAAGL